MKYLAVILCGVLPGLAGVAAELRIGIIGCDTSHAVTFTEMLNNTNAPDHVPGARVVAAFKGGSPDIPSSWSRVDPYSRTLAEKYAVKFYTSIQELCQNVNGVLLESVDGRPHLEQVRPVLEARLPVFIDKPMAGSLADVSEIFRLAKKAKVPVFSASALRFATNTLAARKGGLGRISYVETYGPCEIEPHHPDLFWYGVHGVEALYTVMGPGCKSVQRQTTPDGKIEVIGLWNGQRKGVVREDKDFHGVARGEKGKATVGSFDGYRPLVAEIVKFFQTGTAPVSAAETLEIFAFMEAADASKRQGGVPIKVSDVLKKASH